MRPKSPNSIHRTGPWCDIPPVLAHIGANCRLPNPIGFGGHSPPPATKTSPSCCLLSPPLSFLAAYYCARFKGHQHLLPSSLSVTRLHPTSSLSVVAIYSSSFNASPQLQLLMQLLSCARIIQQCLTPCTSHQIEAQLQFPLWFVLINWIVAIAWVDVLFCNGNCSLFWFSIIKSTSNFVMHNQLVAIVVCSDGFLVICGFSSIIWDWQFGVLGCYGGCAHFWGWMALESSLMWEQILVCRGGRRCALKQYGQARLAQRWRVAGWSFNISRTPSCITHRPATKAMPSRWSLSTIACRSRALNSVLMQVTSMRQRSCRMWLRSPWVIP